MSERRPVLIHLSTIDLTLRFLLLDQMRSARDAGFEVLGMSAPGPWVPDLEADGFAHVPLHGATRSFSLRADLRAARELWQHLRRIRPTVLHTHTPKPAFYGRIVGRMAGVPIIVNTVHGLYAQPDDPLRKRLVVDAMEWLAARFSSEELSQSAEDTMHLRRIRLKRADRLHHLGNGVDLSLFDRTAVPDDVRARLAAEFTTPGIPTVIMVGRLVAEKGWPELVEALEILNASTPRCRLLAIGPAEPEKADAISDDVIARGERAGARFLGERSDVRDLLSIGDVYVLPSHREGFPRSAMEAAAMGLPLVLTDIRGCREVVEPGRNGLLVPVRDPTALAEAIGLLLDDAGQRARLGAAGARRARQDFDIGRVCRRVLGSYRRAAGRRGMHLPVEWPEKIRSAIPGDAREIARLHAWGIPTGFLPTLGHGALAQLYRMLLADPASVVLVSEDEAGRVAGFVAGTQDVGRMYRRFAVRRGWLAGLLAMPSLARPARTRRLLETLRHGGRGEMDVGTKAELLAIVTRERSRGTGAALTAAFLDRLGADRVRVVVAAENEGAIRFYERNGFTRVAKLEVHEGEDSVVLVAGV